MKTNQLFCMAFMYPWYSKHRQFSTPDCIYNDKQQHIIIQKTNSYWKFTTFIFFNYYYFYFKLLSSRLRKPKDSKFTLPSKTLQGYFIVLYMFMLFWDSVQPHHPLVYLHPKPKASSWQLLTNSLSKGYYNFLACCDFGDPTHNSLDSIHPYLELHGSPDHPRAMNATQSSHTCSYTRDNASLLSEAKREKKKSPGVYREVLPI